MRLTRLTLTVVAALASWWAMRLVLAATLRLSAQQPRLSLLCGVIVPVVALALLARISHTPLRAAKVSVGAASAAVALGVCLVLPVSFVIDLTQRWLSRAGVCATCSPVVLRGAPLAPWLVLELFVLGVLVSAVVEELFFRELLFVRLRSASAGWVTVLLAALTFSLSHASPVVMMQALLLGLVLGAVRQLTGTVTLSTLVHGGFNFHVCMLTCMFPIGSSSKLPEYAADLPLYWLPLPLLGVSLSWRALGSSGRRERERDLGAVGA